ncbi:holo-ACP synthase [Microbacterium sp. LMI12-1-1.1]
MIVGIGVDLVDIPRFERTIERTPRLVERLFSDAERRLKPHSLAARYAAKEALIKALGGSDGVHWTEIEVASEASGRPVFSLCGSTAAVVAARGITALHLSLSHDAGLATAYVIAEAAPESSATPNQGNRAEPGDVTGLDEDPLSQRSPSAAPTTEGAA